MAATSNYLTGTLNFFTLLLGGGIIAAGVWFSHHLSTTNCVKSLQIPIIALGIFILLVSLAGFIGSCFRISWLLWIYLFVMLLLILSIVAFTAFAFVVTGPGAGHILPDRSYRDYQLTDYSTWLQKRVQTPANWDKIQSCLSDARICSDLDAKYPTESSLAAAHLSPLESGCCKPPWACGFGFESATRWEDPRNPGGDVDCYNWSNDPGVLCLGCESCKAGVLQRIKMEWRKVALVNVAVFVLLIVVYSVGCCAFWNARKDEAAYCHHPKSSFR